MAGPPGGPTKPGRDPKGPPGGKNVQRKGAVPVQRSSASGRSTPPVQPARSRDAGKPPGWAKNVGAQIESALTGGKSSRTPPPPADTGKGKWTGTPAGPRGSVEDRAKALKAQSGIKGPVGRGGSDAPPTTTTRPPTTTAAPNARVKAERAARAAWVAKNPGKRYTRPTTPADTRSASNRGTTAPAKAKGGVNKATQAVRDARAVASAGGQRYVRKAGGEKSVNKATQAKRLERAKNRKGPVVIAPPAVGGVTSPAAAAARASQRGAVDWQQKAGEYQAVPNQPGINPAWDPNNTDAQYQADANVKYRDTDGTTAPGEIPRNLRAQIVAAMADGKTQVVLPDGEKWAAHQSTLDQIDRNLAEMKASETSKAARNA